MVVHRLVVAGTVESRVMELQEEKRKPIKGALVEKAKRGLGRRNAKDLGFLFVRLFPPPSLTPVLALEIRVLTWCYGYWWTGVTGMKR